MSEVFEAVLCPVAARTLKPLCAEVSTPLSFDIVELPGPLAAMCRNDLPNDRRFSDPKIMDDFAKSLSTRISPILLVRYDSRVGYRSSCLYADGLFCEEFGEKEEQWVPIDENGHAVTTAPRLNVDNLLPNEEYETIQNAIELGLSKLGTGNWRDVKKLLTTI